MAFAILIVALAATALNGRGRVCIPCMAPAFCAQPTPLSDQLSKDQLQAVYGKIQVVDVFPDYKVQIVNALPDLRVQVVTAFPDQPGKWQFVETFPDYKIQFVDALPDFTVEFVDAFPGVP